MFIICFDLLFYFFFQFVFQVSKKQNKTKQWKRNDLIWFSLNGESNLKEDSWFTHTHTHTGTLQSTRKKRTNQKKKLKLSIGIKMKIFAPEKKLILHHHENKKNDEKSLSLKTFCFTIRLTKDLMKNKTI